MSASLRAKRSNPSRGIKKEWNCFATPAMTVKYQSTTTTAVIPRACGGSSTPRLISSIINVSGILDRPPSRTMTGECVSAFSRRAAPEFCMSRVSQTKGAGNAGCTLHPRSRVQKHMEKRTRAYRYSRNTPAFPAQWLYGLCRDLPGAEFLWPPSLANWRLIKPGRADFASAQLGTSNGCRDHTVLPYATTSFVLHAVAHSRTSPCEHRLRARRCRVHHDLSQRS